MCAAEVLSWQSDKVDFRPHLYDAKLGQYILIDSGSQCSAWPPDPGDKVDPSIQLKAANNSRMKCYGYKKVDVKINRKSYEFTVIKSEVESPILGWDFMRKNKLDLSWNEFGDNCIVDKKAKITSVLPYKPLSKEKSLRHKSLSVVEMTKPAVVVKEDTSVLLQQIAAIQDLQIGPEEVGKPGPVYQALLDKYPDLLTTSDPYTGYRDCPSQ